MNENETLTDIDLSDEKLKDLESGTVEIKAGVGGNGDKDGKKKSRDVLKFLLGILCGFILALVCIAVISGVLLFGIRRTPRGSIVSNTVIYKLDLLKTILDVIYYEDVDETDMLEGMYRGLINSTGDKYTVYYSEEDMKMNNASWEGKFFGIGAVLTIDPASTYTVIDSVELGSPAEKAGIKAGDYIKEVDGKDVAGMTLTDVVQLVRGEEGTDVKLTIVRAGRAMEITVTRGEITMDTMYYEKKEDGIAYIQIAKFSDVTVNQFAEIMDEAKKDGAKGVIFDLRGNPGGGLDVVVDILDQFMPKGLMVYTEDKSGNRKDYYSKGASEWKIPMVVLVDGSSASASEIMTAAMKDYGVATIVGKKTYGKGVYQSIYPIPDGSAVKVTSGRFYSPNGVCFHQLGIEPDVDVELDVDAYLEDETDTQLNKAIEVLKEKMNQ